MLEKGFVVVGCSSSITKASAAAAIDVVVRHGYVAVASILLKDFWREGVYGGKESGRSTHIMAGRMGYYDIIMM